MSDLIEQIEHNNGIHEIIFKVNDREAVDHYMEILESLLIEVIQSKTPQKLRILVDLTQVANVPPFAYVTKKGWSVLHEHMKDRGKIHLKTVLLARHDEMTIVSLAESLFKLLPIDAEMKPFEWDDRDEAITWLLADN